MTPGERWNRAFRNSRGDMAILRDAIIAEVSKAVAEETERCAVLAEGDVDWTAFGKRDLGPWENGPDSVRDYRLGIVAGRAIAAAIRAPREGE